MKILKRIWQALKYIATGKPPSADLGGGPKP